MLFFRKSLILFLFLPLFFVACSEDVDKTDDVDKKDEQVVFCKTHQDCKNNIEWDGEYCRGDGRCSSKVFETVWELTAEEPSVVLPFVSDDPGLASFYSGAACDFQILWGDEPMGTDITALPHVTDCVNVENRTHRYVSAGRYHVKIIGTYDGWGSFDVINSKTTSASSKLRSVLSFGPVGLGVKAFAGVAKLELMPTVDIPDASKLECLIGVFEGASSFNAPVGHWDTSHVNNMRKMFKDATAFNQPIGEWDTSQVTDMVEMFSGAITFNQPIGNWDTSQVIDMASMFADASAFNQSIGDWNTSSLMGMKKMFALASSFNQPLGAWDTSVVITMKEMFFAAKAFNQDLSNWTLKKGVDIGALFKGSGMSTANICKLKALGGEWEKRWTDLGKTAICE